MPPAGWMAGLHADRPDPQAYFIKRCVYDKLVVWKHIQQTGMRMTKTIIYLLMLLLFCWFGLTYKQDVSIQNESRTIQL